MSPSVPDPNTTKWLPFGMPSGSVYGSIGARVNRSVVQSIPSNLWTAIIFDRVRWDSSGHWSAANPTRLTCKVAGTYVVVGNVMMSTGGAGTVRYAIVMVNGVVSSPGPGWVGVGGQSSPTIASNVTVPTVVQLNVGDYVELAVLQDSGGALNFPLDNPGNPYNSDFSMVLVGGVPGPPGAPGILPQTLAGTLAANVALPNVANTTIMTVGPLGVGTWIISVSVSMQQQSAGGVLEINMIPTGGLVATTSGATAASSSASSAASVALAALSFKAVVTTAGSYAVNGLASGASGGTALAKTLQGNVAGASGWTAMQVA